MILYKPTRPIGPYRGILDSRYSVSKKLWVAQNGNDAHDGLTPRTARASISGTLAMAKPGESVRALPGDYVLDGMKGVIRNGGNADTLTGYVSLVSDTPYAARLRPSPATFNFNTLDITSGRANYLVIDGFDIQGGLDWGGKGGSAVEIKYGHHYKVINCILRDSAACGLQTAEIDYLLLQNCLVLRNARFGFSHYSGVSLLGPRAFDTAPGFHYAVLDNIFMGNQEGPTITTSHTDGNGIILDVWGQHGYGQQALLEGNLVAFNGHRGIEVLNASYGGVFVRSNTMYKNGQDPAKYGTEGELSLWNSPGTVAANNIMVADPAANSNNVALCIVNDGNSTLLACNLSFNGKVGQSSYQAVKTTSPFVGVNGNLAGVDPLLAMPSADLANADFHLATLSPAIGAGTLAHGCADYDAGGDPRVVNGLMDIGAYQGIGRDN